MLYFSYFKARPAQNGEREKKILYKRRCLRLQFIFLVFLCCLEKAFSEYRYFTVFTRPARTRFARYAPPERHFERIIHFRIDLSGRMYRECRCSLGTKVAGYQKLPLFHGVSRFDARTPRKRDNAFDNAFLFRVYADGCGFSLLYFYALVGLNNIDYQLYPAKPCACPRYALIASAKLIPYIGCREARSLHAAVYRHIIEYAAYFFLAYIAASVYVDKPYISRQREHSRYHKRPSNKHHMASSVARIYKRCSVSALDMYATSRAAHYRAQLIEIREFNVCRYNRPAFSPNAPYRYAVLQRLINKALYSAPFYQYAYITRNIVYKFHALAPLKSIM